VFINTEDIYELHVKKMCISYF